MPKISKQAARPTGRTKSAGVLSRIRKMGFDPEDGIRINLYGRSGTGKTTLWGTFPKPILAIICSGGKEPGELRSIDTPANRKVIDQVSLEKPEELEELVALQNETEKYRTIVLDHATGLQDMVLAQILGVEQIPEQKSWGLATRDQYGTTGIRMKTLLRLLLDLRCNVVIVAQERNFNEESESDLINPYVASALSPSVMGWLGPAADYIAQTFIREQTEQKLLKIAGKTTSRLEKTGRVEYCLRVGPSATYATKFRVPKGVELPEVIVDPDYDKIAKLIQGAR